MASMTEQKHASAHAFTPEDGDLAVQPMSPGNIIRADSPISQASNWSTEPGPTCARIDTPSKFEPDVLGSPFQSPKPRVSMSDTTIEYGEVSEDLFGDSSATEAESLNEREEVIEKGQMGVRKHEVDSKSKTDMKEDKKPHAEEVATDVENVSNNSSPTEAASNDAEACGDFDVTQPDADDCELPKITQETKKFEDATLDSTGDMTVASDEETAAPDKETGIVAVDYSEPPLSVPPHMRPNNPLAATRPSGLRGPIAPTVVRDTPRYTDMPRAPRNQYVNMSRGYDGREELARLSAQLMKVRTELDAERKKSTNMRKSVEEEMKAIMDTALTSCTTDILNKQFKTLAHQGKVDAKERELLFRQACIEQTEIFLSEGQKHVYRQSTPEEDAKGAPLTMAEVHREHERRQAELAAEKNISDREVKLATRLQALQLRESAQQMREQQYKALIRTGSECETRDKAIPNMEAKLNEVAELEYNRGFGAGKVAGRADADEVAREQGFLEGYDSCHCNQVALSKMRQGLIARDSPELDFLYDAAHPHNFFNMGARIAGLNTGKEKKIVAIGTQAQIKERPVQEQRKPEEQVRKPIPVRPTFAAELRGASNMIMHNGHHVLANGSAASAVNGVYEGRKMVKYEVEGESLIDLY